MVNWETPTRCYKQSAKLLLWARFTDTTTKLSKLKCAIHSLSSDHPRKDDALPFFHGDKIETAIRVISAESVLSVAYVLPSVQKSNEEFPDSAHSATYFIVVPPRSTWMDLCMDLIHDYDVLHIR